MTSKREARLARLTQALTALDDNALLDAWKAAVTICQAARPSRNGDEPGLRAAMCEDVAANRFGAGRHVALYAIRHGTESQA